MTKSLFHVLLLMFLSLTSIQAQFSGCDYFQNIAIGQSLDIFSPGYGNYYTAGTNCRWRAQGPINSKLTLNCIDVTIPQNNCNDRLEISWSGTNDPNPRWYCTSQTFSSTTIGNSIDIVLRSQASGYVSGRFRCKLTVQSQSTSSNQCDCGRRKVSRVVNGDPTGVNEITMMAGIVDTRDRSVFCGGTIISYYHVLTSAHCLYNYVLIATVLSVLIGDDDYTITTDTPYSVFYPVNSITIHPSFDRNTNLNDIGIITTAASITFNVAVGPVCLPFPYETVLFTNYVVEAVGWGTIFYGGGISTKLRKVLLNVISNDVCSSYYSNIAPTQICLKTANKDTCQRDSGGPILGTFNGRVYLLGIISYGQGCATDAPSVNSRVTSYLQWILANTYGASYCQ